jgi:hypothetical protein
MKRVSKTDDVSSNSTTKGGIQVIEYHHVVVEYIRGYIRKMTNGIRTVVRFTKRQYKRTIDTILLWTINLLQSIQNRLKQSVYENEPITDVPTMSSIYDSVSSVMYSSKDPTDSQPKKDAPAPVKRKAAASTSGTNAEKKQSSKASTTTPTTTATTPGTLRSGKNLPKAASTASLKKKSATGGVGGKKSAFGSSTTTKHAALLDNDENITAPVTSYLGSLFPTLVTGLVFATAGSMVGYLWNGDWTEAASAAYGYFLGDEQSDGTTATGEETQQQEDAFASTAAPITPEKY